MAVVSTRYAKALLDSASNKKQRDSFKEYLQTIANLYTNNAEFKETLISPQITNNTKVEIVGKAIRCRFQESSAKSVLHLLLW